MKDNSVWDGSPNASWFTILETYNTHYRMKTAFLDEMQLDLLEFVKQQHGSQVRKYINTPYWEHPLSVAEMVKDHKLAIEIALCHDLFEDTDCDFDKLYAELTRIGYSRELSYDICTGVKDLTDVYTKEAYPYLNRKVRKNNEAKRLGQTKPLIQTIKYADLIHNTSSIVDHDPGFAIQYLIEKKNLINEMRNGDIDLLIECCATFKAAQAKLDVTFS